MRHTSLVLLLTLLGLNGCFDGGGVSGAGGESAGATGGGLQGGGGAGRSGSFGGGSPDGGALASGASAGSGSIGTGSSLGGGGSAGLVGAEHRGVGDWVLIGFEDPLSIHLSSVSADEVVGDGGFSTSPPSGTREIQYGGLSNDELSFLLPLPGLGPAPAPAAAAYQFRAFVGGTISFSESGQPVAETESGPRVAWLRPTPGMEGIALANQPHDELTALSGQLVVELDSGPTDTSEYRYNQPYTIVVTPTLVAGDLGAFHESEMTFPAVAGEPVVVGPLPQTAPGHPIEMRLFVDETDPSRLASLWIRTTVSTYSFVPRQ